MNGSYTTFINKKTKAALNRGEPNPLIRPKPTTVKKQAHGLDNEINFESSSSIEPLKDLAESHSVDAFFVYEEEKSEIELPISSILNFWHTGDSPFRAPLPEKPKNTAIQNARQSQSGYAGLIAFCDKFESVQQNQQPLNLITSPRDREVSKDTQTLALISNNQIAPFSESKLLSNKADFSQIKNISDEIIGPCCNCKKTRCLVNYCLCFKNKRFCSSACACPECLNTDAKGFVDCFRNDKPIKNESGCEPQNWRVDSTRVQSFAGQLETASLLSGKLPPDQLKLNDSSQRVIKTEGLSKASFIENFESTDFRCGAQPNCYDDELGCDHNEGAQNMKVFPECLSAQNTKAVDSESKDKALFSDKHRRIRKKNAKRRPRNDEQTQETKPKAETSKPKNQRTRKNDSNVNRKLRMLRLRQQGDPSLRNDL